MKYKLIVAFFYLLLFSAFVTSQNDYSKYRVEYRGTKGPGVGKNIVFVATDHEYRGEETLPALARILAKRYGFHCTVIYALDDNGHILPGGSNLHGLELLDKADLMLSLYKDFQTISQKFATYFSVDVKLEKLSTKLSNWFELDFPDFIKELNKAIKTAKGTPLTKTDEFEWMELFEENKMKALALKAEIDQTDKEIDKMVYELYGLTEEEIQIVENS